ncbi:MAG: response regulator, partial [Bacteroidetes bacterium]|nr:response regulator [Bacteroidota bacterium]
MSNDKSNKKYKLLIIEDDFLNQKLFEASLSKNFDVKICNSAKSFYQLLDQEKFDIFLVDISINGKKNGLDLIRELRQTKEYRNVGIACLSAHVFQIDRINALKAGADIFLT